MQYYHVEYSSNVNKKNKEVQASNKREIIHPKKIEKADVEICRDKWQQLLKVYPQVHICKDAQSILIKPKDTVILSEKYHDLSTNSFLLHAYYNYRQLLLFKYSPTEYYLGVPGIYNERQRKVAILFTFEGFESGTPNPTIGTFGYYMKKVEI